MTLNLQEQGIIVEERGKELFWDHIGQLLFLLSHFLEVSDVSEVSVFPKTKKCLYDWDTNVIYYFVHFHILSYDILMVNTDISITLKKCLKYATCIIIQSLYLGLRDSRMQML